MLSWPEPDRLLEAGPTGPARDAQRAYRAAMEVVGEYGRLENASAQQLMKRLDTLQQSLRQRLTQQITDFRRFNLQQLLADVDRLMAEVRAQIERDQAGNFGKAGKLGDDAAVKPIEAIRLRPDLTAGLDSEIITATFGNAVDLLSVPMQQFATEVKAALRRTVLAGDSKMEELQRLQRSIAGQGFDSAQYRAERIMRTEMGRVFSQATYTKLVGLAQQFPFLKKGWRATPGNRTRVGHAEAGRTYARGQGIPIAQRFVIRVFDERDKKAPKQIGVAQLRFPIDPETTPAGRIAAGATILCRCNAFVDVDVAGYAAHVKNRIGALNLGAAPGLPEPPATPPALPAKPRAPRKPRAPKLPKAPTVPVGATSLPAPAPVVSKVGPKGVPVTAAMAYDKAMRGMDKVKRALAILDGVHGDGALPTIPVGNKDILKKLNVRAKGVDKAQAFYAHGTRPIALGFGTKILQNLPNMGVWHETGHFLDNAGLGRAGFASEGFMSGASPEQRSAMTDLMKALRETRTMQSLHAWDLVGPPDDPRKAGLPNLAARGLNLRTMTALREHGKYLRKSNETFARAYAQYIAVKSGDAAGLAEIRKLQRGGAAFTNRTVGKDTPPGFKVLDGEEMTPGTWEFPWAWQDDEFQEVERAFDRLFDAMGWRK